MDTVELTPCKSRASVDVLVVEGEFVFGLFSFVLERLLIRMLSFKLVFCELLCELE